MDSNYFFGRTQEQQIGTQPRYFYGLRRNDDGEIFLVRVDQLSRLDALEVNNEGDVANNYENFEVGTDFYEGRDVYHNIQFLNLIYEQYRWDDRSLWYYINSDGQLTARANTKYPYPTGISS